MWFGVDKISGLPQTDTQVYRLLALIALSGDFPLLALERLPGGNSYKQTVVKTLKKHKLIRTYYRDGWRTLRITAQAKRLLLTQNLRRYSFYLTGNTDTNRLKSEYSRRYRLGLIAETYVNMLLADIPIFRDEKQAVFSPEEDGNCAVSVPAFYDSREIKELGIRTVKIRGSRMTGILLASDMICLTYNSKTSRMIWDSRAELRARALLQAVLCRERLHAWYRFAPVHALVFGDTMALAYELLLSDQTKKRRYFALDGSFESFYFVTSDAAGSLLLRLLCDAPKRDAVNCVLMQGLSDPEPSWHIENDAVDADGRPVLFAYLFDMPRIMRFRTALELQSRMGVLICFDFQQEVLQNYCKGLAVIQTINPKKLERRFFADT